MSTPSTPPPSFLEALLAGSCVGSTVLAAEVVQISSTRLLHLTGLAFGFELVCLWLFYAGAFGAAAVTTWMLLFALRRWRALDPRSSLFRAVFVAAIAPSVVYPFLVPAGDFRPGSFFGVSREICSGILGLALLMALASSRSGRPSRAAVTFVFAALPLAASAFVLPHTFSIRNAEALPLGPQSTGFRALQIGSVLAGALYLTARVARSTTSPGARAWLLAQVAPLASVLALIAVGYIVVPRPQGPRQNQERPSALVIVVDTLRADALSPYGGPPADSPHLERFRNDAVLFEQCISTAPWTLPSFASLFTSAYPSEHLAGARFETEHGLDRLSDETATLAEVLGATGFATAASLTNSNLARIPALERGFDRYSNGHSLRTYHPTSAWIHLKLLEAQDWYPLAHQQTRWILDELGLAAKTERPFFVLGHYTDPHIPYLAPERFYPEDGAVPPTVVEHYRAEVRHMDDGLGELFDALRERGLYDELMIVVTADHGEELDELRRERKRVPERGVHGHTLFQEQLHVPLLVKLPGNRLAGTARSERVSLIDIAPTVAAVLGVASPATFRGWNLFGDRPATDYTSRVLLAEAVMRREEQKAGFLGELKVVLPDVPPEEAAARVFRLDRDPAERLPESLETALARDVYDTILAHMKLWRARFDGSTEASELDPAMLEHLEALGYTE